MNVFHNHAPRVNYFHTTYIIIYYLITVLFFVNFSLVTKNQKKN